MTIKTLSGVACAASVYAVSAIASAAVVTETASDDWVCTLETHPSETTSSQPSLAGGWLLTRFVSVASSWNAIALDTRAFGFIIKVK